MPISNSFRRLVLACSCSLLALGCNQSQGPIVPVSGRVTYKGVNLQGGYIVFVPDSSRGETGAIACSKILQDGSYNLLTGETHGAATGWYRVTVSSVGPAQSGQVNTFPQSIIPENYRDPEKSQLVCEVKANQVNSIDFHLK